AVVVVVAAAAVIAIVWRRGTGSGHPEQVANRCQTEGPGFKFAVEGGPARCAGGLTARGTLPVGAWLEARAGSVTDVRVADIGDLKVYGDARLRLVGTGPSEHRLELARGHLTARGSAPPRLCVVDTPVAAA